MDNITVARYVGLGVTVVIFIVTVLIMPWVFGVERSPRPTAPDDETARQPAGPAKEPLLKS